MQSNWASRYTQSLSGIYVILQDSLIKTMWSVKSEFKNMGAADTFQAKPCRDLNMWIPQLSSFAKRTPSRERQS